MMAQITEFAGDLLRSHFVNVSHVLAEKIRLILTEMIGEKKLVKIDYSLLRRMSKSTKICLEAQKIGYCMYIKKCDQLCLKMVIWRIDEETREVHGSLIFPVSGDSASTTTLIKRVMEELSISHPALSCENASSSIRFRFIMEDIEINFPKRGETKWACRECCHLRKSNTLPDKCFACGNEKGFYELKSETYYYLRGERISPNQTELVLF